MVPKKPGSELSLYPTQLCVSDCVWASVSPSVQWEGQLGPGRGSWGPVFGCHTVPRWSSLASHSELLKSDRPREHGRRKGVTGHSHSPRAQKTFSLLESDKDAFKTSLWLSKSSSGPPQLSTIGDMSCRSGREAFETKSPTTTQIPLLPSLLPSSPMPAVSHSPSSDLKWLACRSSLDPWVSRSQFTSRIAPEPRGPQRQVFCDTQEGLG